VSNQRHVVWTLIPFTLANFLGFLAVGIPLPVLSIYVHDALGFSPFVVGCIISLQSLATLLTRQYAGRLCDSSGPRRTALNGFASAVAAGGLYLVSSAFSAYPGGSLSVLIVARLVLGLGESLFITSISTWSIARVGPSNAGRAMAWSGIAMYGALAVGAPLGLAIYRLAGFKAVALCACVFPLLGGLLAARLPDAALIAARTRAAFLPVLRSIWGPGLSMALASVGVGTLNAFLTLRYLAQSWPNAGLALTVFGVAYLAMRLLFGGLPDRLGGFRVATVSLLVEATGLLVIWTATSQAMALTGTMLTGLGYSLVFPSLGVQALGRVSSDHRGLVIGAYLACFDLGLAIAGPVSGVVVHRFGLSSAFLAAGLSALSSLALLSVDRWNRRAHA
jgi:predicted MFS family arabinose efflux permease